MAKTLLLRRADVGPDSRSSPTTTGTAWAADLSRHLGHRGIGAGDWVRLQTATGAMRARAPEPRARSTRRGGRARLVAGEPGYDPFSPDGSNLNLTVDPTARDPVSGTISHQANRCEVLPLP
jgi:hypothetical protein